MMICPFCMKEKEDGIQFLNTQICNSCLDKITKVRIEDDKYDEYIDILKDIFKECQLNY